MTHPSGRSGTLSRAADPQPGGVRPPRPPAPSSQPGRGTESFPGLTACGKRSGTAGRRSPRGPAECMVPGAGAARQEDPGRGRAEPSS